MKPTVVAIDGPAASGKSTVARAVATRLGFLYVDSGAVYRAVTWQALEQGVPAADACAVARLVASVRLDFFVDGNAVRLRVAEIAPVEELRTSAVNRHVSAVAAVPDVRKSVVRWLREMAALGPLVMEGRDIGTAVFPETTYKFYLDADPAERAKRRHSELLGGKSEPTVHDVQQSLKRRDRIDSGRKMDPLAVAQGATVIDSTSMSVDDVVAAIVARLPAGLTRQRATAAE